MALQIPKEEVASIKEIKQLSKPTIEQIVAAMRGAPLASSPSEMAKYLAQQLPSLPGEQLSRMLGTIYTLYHIRELSGVSKAKFLEDLMSGIENIPGVEIAEEDLPRIQSLFERIMDIEVLNVVAKAYRLQRDGERLYCAAKILSDIRPVFREDPAAGPAGAVLAHTLKVGYHEGREHHEFHVVLDGKDLDALGEVVKRAQLKNKALRDFLKGTNLPNLEE